MGNAELAAVKCGAVVVGAAALTYAAVQVLRELLPYAVGQAIVAGASLPALLVFGVFVGAYWAFSRMAPSGR